MDAQWCDSVTLKPPRCYSELKWAVLKATNEKKTRKVYDDGSEGEAVKICYTCED